jgi:hypothetical protein
MENQKIAFQRPKTMLKRSYPLQLLQRNTANLKTLITLLRNLQHDSFGHKYPIYKPKKQVFKYRQEPIIQTEVSKNERRKQLKTTQ